MNRCYMEKCKRGHQYPREAKLTLKKAFNKLVQECFEDDHKKVNHSCCCKNR